MRSPSARRSSAKRLRGTISPLRSTARRLPVSPSSSRNCATVGDRSNSRGAPFTRMRMADMGKLYLLHLLEFLHVRTAHGELRAAALQLHEDPPAEVAARRGDLV